MKTKKLLLIVFIMSITIMTGCSKDEVDYNDKEDLETSDSITIEDIKNKGRLVMGTNADYPPFEFHLMENSRDEIVGLDVSIAEYIASDLGVDLEIKDMKFNNLLGGISTGMIDIAVAGMNPEPEREKQVSFSDIYYEVNLSVLARKEDLSKYNSENDLEGKKIGVQMGTTQEDIARGIKNAETISLKTNSDAVMNLKTNKLDVALLETIVAESFAKTNEDIEVVDKFIIKTKSGGSAIATQKGNKELVNYLNEKIKEMKEKGLIDKWMEEAKELSNREI